MGESLRTKVVVSAVNFTSGGPLSVLIDCLTSLLKYDQLDKYEITVLVHKKELVSQFTKYFQIFEYPEIKSSWLNRVNFEYKTSMAISKKIRPKIWISLHDMTPNVISEIQYVYCHNPAPFYKISLKEVLLDFKFFLFNKFYKFLYKINIKRNQFVIVQQNWLRQAFKKMYGVKTIVGHPSLAGNNKVKLYNAAVNSNTFTFFYPSFPRVFKNFEVILNAAALLSETRQDFELVITIDGTENKYSKMLYQKYASYQAIKFVGKLTRDQVFEQYIETGCLLFPSKLETWGLPITEFKNYNKPIILADLPYAHETLGEFDRCKFFNPDDHIQLAEIMNNTIDGNLSYDLNTLDRPVDPFFEDWDGLVKFLLENR